MTDWRNRRSIIKYENNCGVVTMLEKTPVSRGPRTDQAKMLHRLKVLGEISESCLPLAQLIDDLAQRKVSKVDVELRLKELQQVLEAPLECVISDSATDENAAVDLCARSLQRITAANARIAILRRAAITIDTAIKVTLAEADDQWSVLKIALAKSEPSIPDEVMHLAQMMVEAGVTARSIKAERTKGNVVEAAKGMRARLGANTAQASKQPCLPHIRLREIWGNFPQALDGYSFRERAPQDRDQSQETIKFYLPPFTSVDEIEPGLSLTLKTLPSNRARFSRVSAVLSNWIEKHDYRPGGTTGVSQVRAWCFALGYVHDFLDGVPEFQSVTLASPWTPNVLEASRT